MTKNQYAWSVRGISREARNQAKEAAGERHITTGEWVSLALTTVAERELAISPDSLPLIGPLPIASSVDDQMLDRMDARERALLALASKRLAPKGRAAQEQQSPWSVRGVSQVARVKAAQVAAHRRVTIGEWVNHAIQVYAGQQAGVEYSEENQNAEPSRIDEVPEKTMKLVETLARHFDTTRSSDAPKIATPDTIREVERANHALRPADTAPVAATQPSAANADSTEQKISELAYQVLGAERRNEQRLSALTEVLTRLAERLKLSDTGEPIDQRRDADTLSKAEMVFWESIKDSNDPDAYKSYLANFPDGLFASLAKRRSTREALENAGEMQSPPGAEHRANHRPPPVSSYPKLDYDKLNKRAVENTKRRN
ncbi:MAG: hypothetical protein VCD50_12015 [Alphaproteobacteria bacterium]